MADDSQEPRRFDDTHTPDVRAVLVGGSMRAVLHVTHTGGWPKSQPWVPDPAPPTLQADVEEIRDANTLARTRTETASSSYPVLVNNKQEEARLDTTLVRYRRPYPMLAVERKDASVLLLFIYLVRVIIWRMFFARAVQANPMQVNPHKILPPKGGDAVKPS